MATYIGGIFLSAFLLFQVQPMIAHYILPWFGGTNSVWSAVVLFFQLALIGGYLYAHWLNESVPQRRQWQIHSALLGFALTLIALTGFFWPSPVTPAASWKPTADTQPILHIFLLLTISVGLPYFTLASNSPLVQAWFSRTYAGRSPYWLYALSNFGSMFGLLSYPFIVEPTLRLQEQGWLWSALYALFALLTGYGAWRAAVSDGKPTWSHSDKKASPLALPKIPLGRRFLWLLLSAIATLMLLAVTNRLSQEVAPVPLLWTLPLSVYLLSFIIAFSGENYYNRLGFSLLLTITSIGIIFTSLRPQMPLWLQISFYLLFLFAICMIAHGELYRLRPAPAHLTHFYLLLSIGGALGGIIVNFLAPLLFNDYWEFYLGWLAIYLLLIFFAPATQPARYKRRTFSLIGFLAV
ncbi:MAG: ferrichrome ABC transporter permease, partial [Anaerolineales bacterium]